MRNGHPFGGPFLLLVVFILVLIVVLISVLVLILVLVVILGTVAVLIVHNLLPSSLIFAVIRYNSMPFVSGFILWFKQETGKKSGKDGSCNTSCSCFQTSREDSQKAILCDGFSDTLCQGVSKSR